MLDLGIYSRKLRQIDPLVVSGKVRKAGGLVIESEGPGASVGEICRIHPGNSAEAVDCEVIGFRDSHVISMPLCPTEGIQLGDRVVSRRKRPSIRVGPGLLGRVIDGSGQPLDDRGPLVEGQPYPLNHRSLNPLERQPIDAPLGTGVRSIDGLLSVGRGQRVGIFGGSGVGKSTLLGMMAKHTEADVNVIGLIGERGREVRSFVERDLGEEGLKKSVLVVSTSDSSPLMRLRGALAATAAAEYFCGEGKNVLLVVDSVTRIAMAQREIGLAAGEPPSSKGYTPSVFALLPRLFERAGNFPGGSITGFYTVLVEGDDMNDPIADAVRGLLDGHVVLSRELAQRNHFPSIDVLESISRLMPELSTPGQAEAAARLRRILGTYRKAEDMISIGAYQQGTNPEIDTAVARIQPAAAYLQQAFDERVTREEAVQQLMELVKP